MTDPRQGLRLLTLGHLSVLRNGAVVPISSRRGIAILVYTACNAGRRLSRDQLATLFWADAPDRKARHSLSQVLYQVRQLIPEIESNSTDIWLAPEAVWLDTAAMAEAHRANRTAEVVRLYGGGFLDGFHVRGAAAFEDWRYAWDQKIGSMVRSALYSLAKESEFQADWGTLEGIARDLLRLDGQDDEALALLAKAITKAGDPIRAYSQFRRIEAARLEGIPGSDTVLRPVSDEALSSGATRLTDSGELAMPRFTGRLREFHRLRRVWELTEQRGVQVVLITGEAGIGKTRLARHFLRLAVLRGARILEGRCYFAERTASYAALLNVALPALNEDPADPSAQGIIAEIEEVVAASARPKSHVSAAADRLTQQTALPARIADQFAKYIATSAAPGVLFFDDFHWADEASAEVFARLPHLLRGRPILLIASLREEELANNMPLAELLRSADNRNVETLRVRALASNELLDLIDECQVAWNVQLTEHVRERIAKQSVGRPLFVLEAIAALRESELLDLTPPHSEVIEESFRNRIFPILSQRLDVLPTEARRVLSVLAVIGRNAPAEVVHRAARLRLSVFEAALRHLTDAGLIADDGNQIGFVHEIVQEVAYERIPRSVRRLMHRRVAAALERSGMPHLGTLAIHYHEAGDRLLTYGHAMRAACVARDAGTYADEEFFVKLALENAKSEDQFNRAERARARLLAATGRYTEAARIHDRLRGWYRTTGDLSALIDADAGQLAIALAEGTHPVKDLLRRSQDLASQAELIGDVELQVRIYRSLATSAHGAGEGEYLEGLAPQMISSARRLPLSKDAIELLAIAGNIQSLYGRSAEACETVAEALGSAERLGEVISLIAALTVAGQANLVAGRPHVARDLLQRALDLSAENGAFHQRVRVLINYGVALMELGALSNAVATFESCLGLAGKHDQLVIVANLAAIACERAVVAEIELWLETLERLNEALGAAWANVVALSFRAYARMLVGDIRAAEQLGRQAGAALDAAGWRIGDRSYSELYLARVLERTDGSAVAIDRLTRLREEGRTEWVSGRLRLELEALRISNDAGLAPDEERVRTAVACARSIGSTSLLQLALAVQARVRSTKTLVR